MIIDIILKNGKKIMLYPDTQIEWVQENMFFEDDVQLRGKYSFPFSINRLSNSDTLNFPDEMQVKGKILKRACTVYVMGQEFYKGQLVILDWDDKNINVVITRDTEEVNTGQYIDEMGLKEYIDIAEFPNRNTDKLKVYPDVDYAWPQIHNSNEAVLDKYGAVGGFGEFIFINYNQGNSMAANGKEIVVPHFYLLSVLKAVCDKLGLGIRSSLFTNEEFKKLLIYNTTVPCDDTPYNFELYGEAISPAPGATPLSRVFLKEKASFNIPVGSRLVLDVDEISPVGGVVTSGTLVLLVTAGMLGTGYTGVMQGLRNLILASYGSASVFIEDYTVDIPNFYIELSSGNYLSIRTTGVPLNIGSNQFYKLRTDLDNTIVYNSPIKMQNHLPHITVSDFLNKVKNMFNLNITLDELVNEVIIEKRIDFLSLYKKPDYSDKLLDIAEGSPNDVPNYVLVFDHDKDNDAIAKLLPLTADNYPESKLSPKTEIGIETGTTYDELKRNSNSGFGILPVVDQELGNYTEKGTFNLRFLYLHGYVADNAGFRYVKASNNDLLPNDIYNLYYGAWYDLIKNMHKAPTYYFDFGLDILLGIKPAIWKVQLNDYMWKRITTVIHNTKGIGVSKVEGYKI